MPPIPPPIRRGLKHRTAFLAPPATAPGLPACLRYRLRRVVTHTLDLRSEAAVEICEGYPPIKQERKSPWRAKSTISTGPWAMGHVQVRFLYDICMYTKYTISMFKFAFIFNFIAFNSIFICLPRIPSDWKIHGDRSTFRTSRCLAERMPYSLTYPRALVPKIHLQSHPSSWFIVIDI